MMDEYINKESLRDSVYESLEKNPHNDPAIYQNHMYEHLHFLNLIDREPDADVAPVRHGYWIEDEPYHDEEGYIIQQFYCSECGRYEEEREPYCNCGAKMDGE